MKVRNDAESRTNETEETIARRAQFLLGKTRQEELVHLAACEVECCEVKFTVWKKTVEARSPEVEADEASQRERAARKKRERRS